MATAFDRWWVADRRTPLQELRRAANANLRLIADGAHRRSEEAAAAERRAARAAREELRRLDRIERLDRKERILEIRRELAGLEPLWRELMAAHEGGTLGTEVGRDWGALEEVDHRRDTLYAELEAARLAARG